MRNANRVRSVILGSGDTITLAAEKLDIGRPALSNVLNAKADLSIELALKIEAVYRYEARDLLYRQLNDQIQELKENGGPFINLPNIVFNKG